MKSTRSSKFAEILSSRITYDNIYIYILISFRFFCFFRFLQLVTAFVTAILGLRMFRVFFVRQINKKRKFGSLAFVKSL